MCPGLGKWGQPKQWGLLCLIIQHMHAVSAASKVRKKERILC